MSKRVADSPKIEARNLWSSFDENDLFEYFFDDVKPPDGILEEDYLTELRHEYFKLKREEAKRLLGLE